MASINPDARQQMRQFVHRISARAKARAGGRPFYVVPQNGLELLTCDLDDPNDDSPSNPPALQYLDAIDAVGQEAVHFGLDKFGVRTPKRETKWLDSFLTVALAHGKTVLAVDYTAKRKDIEECYSGSEAKGYVGFAAQNLEVSRIPSFPKVSHCVDQSRAVTTLGKAKNFLYLLNPEFSSLEKYVSLLSKTSYDGMVIDACYDEQFLSPAETDRLRHKGGTSDGAIRPVIAYLSIGEAEDYRWYWDESWRSSRPAWLEAENPEWDGNYKVRYWDPEWQSIIFDYADKIVDAGFDGVYLDIIDGFEYFSASSDSDSDSSESNRSCC